MTKEKSRVSRRGIKSGQNGTDMAGNRAKHAACVINLESLEDKISKTI
jgi:hypothetical protein